MAGDRSDLVFRQVHRLFNLGAVGTIPDSQLLDQFVARRDEAAEAAFEELVIRHGPMVLRVCRSILHDAHDAEDAFQAVFLVLANRARSIRRSGSVASWLFGVAQRVANRGKRSAARRRSLIQHVAERTFESELPAENDPDPEVLQEEINGLPDGLRAPIVLCYLQGLTYAAAAHQLGLSEIAIRGRLARARERLRPRLARRGVTIPAGLVVAGAAGQTQAAIPMTLIQSTIRIALGFMAGNTAAILARGVLNSMLLSQLRVATVLLCFGIGGSYWAWHSFASADDKKGQADPAPAVVRVPVSSQPPKIDRYGDPLPPGAAMRLGTARFRQAQLIKHIIYASNGQLIVTDNGQDRLLIRNAQDGRELRQVNLGIEDIRDLAVSPDAQSIAAVGFRLEPKRNVVVNQISVIDMAKGEPIGRVEWDDQVNVEKVAYAPDGKTAATMSLDSTLRLWNVATSKLLKQEKLVGDANFSPESFAFSTDAANRLLAIAGRGALDVWDVAQIRRHRSIPTDDQHRPDRLVFSPDGTTLAAGVATREAEIRLWRVGDGSLIRRFKSRENALVLPMAFSPDGKVLAGIGIAGRLIFFDVATGAESDVLPSVRVADGPLAFSPDGKTLASTGDRQTLHSWDLATGRDRLATPEAHVGDIVALTCLADGKTLVSGSRDRTVRIWNRATGQPTKTLPHDSSIDSLSVSADGSLLMSGSSIPELGRINVWNLKNGERLRTWPVDGAKTGSPLLKGAALSGDRSAVLAAWSDGTVRCWEVSTGKERPIAQPKLEKIPSTGPGGGPEIPRVIFSHDGRSAAFVGELWVQVVDLPSGDRRFKAPKALSSSRACEFAPDGGSLAVVSEVRSRKFQAGRWRGSSILASTIGWLDSQSGVVRRQIEVPEFYVWSLAFSPDGQNLAVATLLNRPARGFIRIFRLRDKREIQTIESPCAWIDALCFTPDGKQIVAGLQDTSIVIWDVHSTDY